MDWGNRRLARLAMAVFALGVAATAGRTIRQYQTPGPFDPSRQGMCDFHNGIYFPTKALIAGTSPYGQRYADEMPVARQIPFFSPAILAAHIPFAVMPLRVAEIAYFVFSVGLVLLIAKLIVSLAGMPGRLDAWAVAAAGIVFTRAGHITLFDGYFTLELILATFLAIHWGPRRPMPAALALVIVSAKPTYILPLGFLMLARGNYRALVFGAIFSVIAAGVPFAWLAYHEGDGEMAAGLSTIGEQISQTQEIHRGQEDESPVHSWTRLDLLAVLAKWSGKDPDDQTHLIVMAMLLLPPMWLLFRRARAGIDDGVTGVTGAIILTSMLVCLYHQSYDALLMAAPFAGVFIARQDGWRVMSIRWRAILGLLMIVPAFNYLSTRMVLSRLNPSQQIVDVLTSLNGVCLAALLILLCWVATDRRPE